MEQTTTPKPDNRRISGRRRPRGKPRVEMRKGTSGLGPNLADTVLDISETGARLTAREALPKGEMVEVLLSGQGYTKPLRVYANVVWVKPVERGFEIGIHFEHRLRYADFQQMT